MRRRHQPPRVRRAAGTAAVALLLALSPLPEAASGAGPDGAADRPSATPASAAPSAGTVQLGPRPFFLADDMDDGPLKHELQACAARGGFTPRVFSIGHRGAPLQFPEHTVESYTAAARMGAGVVECDVTFTKDKVLVCRHAQNDLHRTTDILVTPLAARCHQPFAPATFGADGRLLAPATAECRTSDLTLAEFRSLRGKMDAFDTRARTPAEALGGTAAWRTELYAGPTSGTLLTHRESIDLLRRLGVQMTPELKAPVVDMPFDGFTREAYAQRLIDELQAAGVPPEDVRPQSFRLDDLRHWLRHAPAYGRRAVLLVAARSPAELPPPPVLADWHALGVRTVAPPLFALLAVDAGGRIVPSAHARQLRAAGLDILTWTLERSGVLAGGGGYYFQTVEGALRREGDVYRVLDVLAREVGVLGVFSDWPATTSFYAHCAGLR